MKTKLKHLIKYSLKKNIFNKTFYISNIILLLIICVAINFDLLSSIFSKDNKEYIVNLIDETQVVAPFFKETYKETVKTINEKKKIKVVDYDKDVEAFKKDIKKDDNQVLLIIKKGKNIFEAEIYSKNGLKYKEKEAINMSLNNIKNFLTLKELNIDALKFQQINEPVKLKEFIEDNKDDVEAAGGAIFTILIIPMFMLITMVIQIVGASINEEKNTKAMEVIISCVDAKTHLWSKIISGNLYVLVQLLMTIFYVLLALFIRFIATGDNVLNSGVLKKISDIFKGVSAEFYVALPLIIILMLLTIVAYSIITAVFASMTTSQEDFQKILAPIMTFLMIGYYLAIAIPFMGKNIVTTILGYLPFISALTAPGLYTNGSFSVYSLVITNVVMVIMIGLLVFFGSKIYKVGILNYSSKDLFKRMFKIISDKSRN